MKKPRHLRAQGFTLVELLIVVAIIGVLSSITVPTFRKMVQKARAVEAKLHLSAIYRAEQVFYSEYEAYGNHLSRMGVELAAYEPNFINLPSLVPEAHAMRPRAPKPNPVDGKPRYAAGFSDYSCELVTIVPDPTSLVGQTIISQSPNYYSWSTEEREDNPSQKVTVAGHTSLTQCAAGVVPAPDVYLTAGAYDTYVAAASGVIAPGIDPDAPAASDLDVWTINEQGSLVHVQDGSR